MNPGKRASAMAALLLVAAVVAAYATSFRGVLVFDDLPGIANNPTIRDLRRLDLLLVAIGPQGGTLSGRPVPNLTLALNHAISGSALWGYHAVNLLIHVLAALTLFGLVRRTLQRPVLSERFGAHAVPLALAIASLWSLHPLQTESVTYLVQRVESLMGLCYLLTLYCFVRAMESPHPRRWFMGAFFACLTGMGCKEVMVSAPLLVWLYDRAFVATSWRETWQRRRWFYVSLMSTWLLLGTLVLASGGRGGTAGFSLEATPWHYALTQSKVILAYVQLALWPHPLIFDHNVRLVTRLGEVWPHALVVVGLLGATIHLIIRRPAAGFVGAWFFAILAPTSSFVPVADAMFEHRMYLPLATVVVLVVLGLHSWTPRAMAPFCVAAAIALGIATAERNLVYASPLKLWGDVARKVPANPRAHDSIGAYLFADGRFDEAREQFATAIRLDPEFAPAHFNLGRVLEKNNRLSDAVDAYGSALHHDPKLADAHVNLANVLDRLGRTTEAVPHYEAALRLDPGASDIEAGLGAALLKLKRLAPAIEHLKSAVELDPAHPDIWCNLARAYQQQGDLPAARRAAERAFQLRPDFPEALYLLGNLDAAAGNFAAAIPRFARVTELAPDFIPARNNLANALLMSGRPDEAIRHYREILRVRPDDRAVQENLARALEAQGSRTVPR